MTRAQTKAAGQAVDLRDEVGEAEDLLRILLKQWSDSVQDAKDADFENVWDKETPRAAPMITIDSSAAAGGPAADAVSIDKSALNVESGIIGAGRKAQAEFTVDELFRRLRKIEKLTRLIKQDGEKEGKSCPKADLKHQETNLLSTLQ